MTGITRVSKESIFSDLNNMEVVTTTSVKYADVYGFTEDEVKALCETYKKDFTEVKRWYDGYLGYDQYTRTAFIPNEEIRQELTMAVETQPWNEMLF